MSRSRNVDSTLDVVARDGNGSSAVAAQDVATTEAFRPTPGHVASRLGRGSSRLARRLDATLPELGISASLALAALVVWLTTLLLTTPDLEQMSDIGLVSVLPWGVVAAVGLLVVGFAFTVLRMPKASFLLVAYVLLLIFVFFGTPAVLEDTTRFHVAWRHAGIAEAIVRTGEVFPELDVYGNWPGFFFLAAYATKLLGLSNPIELANWTPVALNLVYLGPLYLLFRSATENRRLIWLAIWIFYSANWVGQDYFSPQGFAYAAYIGVVAILFAWGAARYRGVTLSPGARVALAATAILLTAACIPVHQLTPIQIVLSATVIALVMRPTVPLAVPVLFGLMLAAWWLYMATPFLDGRLADKFADVGRVGDTLEASIGERVTGSSGHILVTRIRLYLSAAIALVALLGAVRWLVGSPRRRLDATLGTLALLALVPALLPALQSYGGEIGFRAFFFALPFFSFFAATFFASLARPRLRAVQAGALVLVLGLLVSASATARYGNERADYFTKADIAAVDRLYDMAPPRAALLVIEGNVPWKHREYEQHKISIIDRKEEWDQGVDSGNMESVVRAVARDMRAEEEGAFLLITRSQLVTYEIFRASEAHVVRQFTSAATESPEMEVVFQNEDAVILTAVGARALAEHRARRGAER